MENSSGCQHLQIYNLILEYNDEIKKALKGKTYPEEMDFLVQFEPRNKFIRNLALKQIGNTLVLFQYVENIFFTVIANIFILRTIKISIDLDCLFINNAIIICNSKMIYK
jgi:hypothetical protein